MSEAIVFNGQPYAVAPRLDCWLEMEDELGSLPALQQRLVSGQWRVAELVTAVQILLAAAGCECDYKALGEDMLGQGLEGYRRQLTRLLASVTGVENERMTA